MAKRGTVDVRTVSNSREHEETNLEVIIDPRMVGVFDTVDDRPPSESDD